MALDAVRGELAGSHVAAGEYGVRASDRGQRLRHRLKKSEKVSAILSYLLYSMVRAPATETARERERARASERERESERQKERERETERDVGDSGYDPVFYYSFHHNYSDCRYKCCSLFRILYH